MKKLNLLLFFLTTTFLASAQISFDASTVLFDHPRAEDTGLNYPCIPLDYNSDGLVDFIGATFNDQFLFKGEAGGTFEQLDIYQGFSHIPLKVMDFDNDGDMDIIMERYINIYETADSFFFLNPNVNFLEDIVEVADFNGDGFNDLLTHKSITFEDDEINIHYNQGDNTFISETIYEEYDYGDIEVADIDGDGNLDILALITFQDPVAVILFNTSNSFTPTLLSHVFDPTRTTIKLIDLDGDSDLDILTAGTFDNLYVLENTDNFATDNSTQLIPLGDVNYFSIGDMDNDGDMDIVTASIEENKTTISSVENQGNLTFGFPAVIEEFVGSDFFGYPNFNYVSNNLNLYDVDGDAKLDIIYTDGFGEPNQVKMMKNTSTSTSTNNFLVNNKVSLFPNPTNNEFLIEGIDLPQEFYYEIFSVVGSKVKEGISNSNVIRVNDLESGIYSIRIDQLHTAKFSKL